MAFALGLGMSTSVLAVGKDENLAPAEFHADTAQQLLVTYDLGTAAGAGSFNAGAAAGKRHPVTEQLAQRYGMTPIKEWPLDVLGRLCVVFRKAQGQSIDALAAELRKDARVRSVQGIHQYYATSSSR